MIKISADFSKKDEDLCDFYDYAQKSSQKFIIQNKNFILTNPSVVFSQIIK
jgi:hypothetical protein